MDCWAACLGGCSGKASREHLVSESLFIGDKILVQGLPWCIEAKTIGLAGLTAKILCEHHNNQLSPIDDAGAQAFNTFREIRRIANVRKRMKTPPIRVVQHKIDGPSLERWFLKTLINISYNGDYPIGQRSTVAGRPTDELVRIAYGLDSFKGRAGLYFVVRTGMQVVSEDTVKFSPLIRDDHIERGLFVFRGQSMLLHLEPEGQASPLQGIHMGGEDFGTCQLNFHNERIDVKQGRSLSQVLRISWPSETP
jgi:hypothetical protein